RIAEPAADLAVAAALASSHTDRPVPPETVVFGEIGLSGEVRPVNHMDQRLKEAAKLGFSHAIIPARPRKGAARGGAAFAGTGLRLTEVSRLYELLALFEEADAGRAGKPALAKGAASGA
ncbi:MAG: magnesium chelatase domain-containing protein, partial [Alphaproteobacteria bacterium]